jgi:hypothetical protein
MNSKPALRPVLSPSCSSGRYRTRRLPYEKPTLGPCCVCCQAYETKVNDYLLSFDLMGNEDDSILAKLRHAKRELGTRYAPCSSSIQYPQNKVIKWRTLDHRCMGKKRFLSGQLVEFTENPLTRFDEDVKLARAYDQWVRRTLSHVRCIGALCIYEAPD